MVNYGIIDVNKNGTCPCLKYLGYTVFLSVVLKMQSRGVSVYFYTNSRYAICFCSAHGTAIRGPW